MMCCAHKTLEKYRNLPPFKKKLQKCLFMSFTFNLQRFLTGQIDVIAYLQLSHFIQGHIPNAIIYSSKSKR